MAFSARMSAFNLISLFVEKISSLRVVLFFNSKAPPSIADFFAVVSAFFYIDFFHKFNNSSVHV